MDEILTHVLATGISFAPIMMIITEGVKQTKLLDSRYKRAICLKDCSFYCFFSMANRKGK